MQQAIQFETVIDSGVIHVPEQYINSVPTAVTVTLSPAYESFIIAGAKSKAGMLSADSFSALKINTKNWKFDREEANERR